MVNTGHFADGWHPWAGFDKRAVTSGSLEAEVKQYPRETPFVARSRSIGRNIDSIGSRSGEHGGRGHAIGKGRNGVRSGPGRDGAGRWRSVPALSPSDVGPRFSVTSFNRGCRRGAN